MKTKEYIEKYGLDKPKQNFNHQEFVGDLTADFFALLEVGNSRENIKGFENAVRAIRMKYDGINNKTVGCLPEGIWKYFYATVVAPLRDRLFPEVLAERERIRKEREAYRRREAEFEREMFGSFFFDWDNMIKDFLSAMIVSAKPVRSFEVLGLSVDASAEDVKSKFRELSFLHHPDKGGSQDKFIEIVDAKNRCLAYLNR
ncbi:MAG TPA: J domain-containing protein [Lentimicrobium sp.]|nr:J domain-containing protein [Lentimicrobium sp.]